MTQLESQTSGQRPAATGRRIAPCPYSPRFLVDEAEAWKSLTVFWFYRLIMAAILVNLFMNEALPTSLHPTRPDLFARAALTYLGVILLAGIPLVWRRPAYEDQAQLQVFADLLLLPFLIHASGGVGTGTGVLLGMSVAAGGILVGGRCAVLFAALATMAVLVEEVYGGFDSNVDQAQYTYGGLLGASFFGIAFLAVQLARLTEKSEALAEQRGTAIVNLQQINEYIIQNLETGILVIDAKGAVRLHNESAARLLPAVTAGRLEAAGSGLAGLFEAWRADPGHPGRVLERDGAPDVHVDFTPLGHTRPPLYLINLEDSAAHNRRVQLSKLASLGRLTASIAHEIRNPLGAISHASQLLAESPALGGQDLRLIQIILDHSARLNTVVENVLQISRRREAQRETLKLETAITRWLDEFRTDHGLDASAFVVESHAGDPEVVCDRTHLRQIMENLCSNALKYGQPEKGPILLRIVRRAGVVSVEIVDHGPSIDRETAGSLFEPFFTTAPDGTGLGLFIARELAELNQARLEYANGDEGHCFRLSLRDAGPGSAA